MVGNVIAPGVAGVVLAFAALFGLVSAQTSAPAENPADQPVIVYGDR